MEQRHDDPELRPLAERVAGGDYRVDPVAVAEAILRRARELVLGDQNECSKPVSEARASVNRAPGSPASTRPIHVIRTASFVLANFASIELRPSGGTQTQSS